MWGVTPSDRYDWEALKASIVEFGLRNSLTLALMPTASCFTLQCQPKLNTEHGIKTYTEILEENGIDWKEIEKTDNQQWFKFNDPFNVHTRHGLKETSKVFYNGHKEVFSLELEDGTVLECTGNHKFLVNRNGIEEWVETRNLKDDDDIVEYKK